MKPAIEVDDVSKRFRLYTERNQSLKATVLNRGRARFEEFWALEDVSFDVAQGETFGLVGENGSGKSTLLKCMAQILQPDKGSIRINGRLSALLELGAGFHPELSGRENVYLNASILGMTRKEVDARFDDIVEFAGLERFIDTPVKNYSSGMYVRLGFSVAVQAEPDILLIDEVLAVGDESFQRKCAERLSELRHSGVTIVVVSHGLGTLRNICDRVIWLQNGKTQDIGDTSAIIDSYLGEVEVDRQGPPAEGARWGSGEAVIDHMELVDLDGRSVDRIRTGDQVAFRLHYDAPDPVPKPVFGIVVHTADGFEVSCPNTREAGHPIEELHGRGHVDLVVDALPLLPGTYDLSAGLADWKLEHIYDHRHRALRFDVDVGTPHESRGGFVTLNGKWDSVRTSGSARPSA